MTKMDHNQMAGKTGTTRHGERVVYVGPAMDPARVRVRPLTPGADVFAPRTEHVVWDEERDPRGPADRKHPANEPQMMPVPEGIVPATLEVIVPGPTGGLFQLEVDEDGCIEDPDNEGGVPIGYVVRRDWFLSAQALKRDLDAGARELRMGPYDGPPRTDPGTLVRVLHPFSGTPIGTGVVLGHEVGPYDHGSPESGPGPVEDTDLTRVLMVEGPQAGSHRLVLDSDLDALEDQKSGIDVGRGLTRREQRHCEFVRDTLVPDLRESGSDATADDFDELLNIISDLASAPE